MGGKKGLRHTLADFRPGCSGQAERDGLDIWADRPSWARTENPIVRARPGGLLAFDRKDLHMTSGPLAVNAIAGYFGHIPRKYVENVYGLPFMRANAVSSSSGRTTQDARATAKWNIEVGGASKSKRMARHIEVADRARRRAMRDREHRNSAAAETWCANMENPTKLHNAWRDYGIVGYKGFKPFWKTDKDFHLKKRELGKPNPPYLPRASYHTILVSCLAGIDAEGALDVQLNAPARDGEANEELIAFLSREVLAVKKKDVALIQGSKRREKVVEISDALTAEGVSRLLQNALQS
ncbi:hypothetical protein FOZ61_000207 [Perkinsus olseni]|uniref:Uncharacterized protein n=1 Tax=Perkinsus olseni TaxID=32597 RepID=A0A7J6M0M8_PEROL|nr:hypothetical protein FOZ61_000207 [Perkinsus olseni]